MKVKPNNYIAIEFPSRSVNEGLARAAVAAFAAQLDPTLDELGDIKTAVSEAVTNAIVHAYPQEIGKIALRARLGVRHCGRRKSARAALHDWR